MRRRFSFIAVLAALVSLLPMGGATLAQEPAPVPDRSIFQGERPQVDPDVQLEVDNQLAAMQGPSKIVIELADQPTTLAFASAQANGVSAAQATAQAKTQLATINTAQQRLQAQLTAPAVGAQVIYRTQRVLNAIAVQVDASKFAQIKALPGVKAIYPSVTKYAEHTSSVPLIGAPEVWQQYGIAGDNITIGIIDTGIDYLHTNFGGPGTQAAYDANTTTVVGDNQFYPNAKVVGGFDFVGDAYNGDNAPVPDPDPLDCNGHGSHVAGTAGGYGVNADGSTYTGSYNAGTNFNALRIGPGVAAKAQLFALRVFGCDGSTNVTELAIEYSVDPNGDGDFSDRLDVINMSLGSDFGSAFDTSAVASDNAAAAGVVVVASAGNSGDTYYITGSPATSSRTISVASSVDSTDTIDGFRVNTPSAIAGVKPSSNAINYDFTGKPPVTGDVVYPPSQRSGCQAFTAANAALLAGKIALLDWTIIGGTNECGSGTRVNNAANAGAIGVILVYPNTFIAIAIGGSTRIPSTITTAPVGDQIKAQLAANTPVNATLTNEYNGSQRVVAPERNDTLSDFTSRGPRRGDNVLKPDIAAPGQTIFSAAALTGNQGVSFNGTSMAAPHVAGTMALLRQLHPDWSVAELKALAMNTANNDLRSQIAADSQIFGPGRVGAGRVDVPDAAASQVVAYNADSPELVSVSFGNVEVVGTATATRRIRVLNKSNQARTYNVQYRPVVDVPGVSYALSTNSVTLPAFGSTDVVVTMTATAAQMKHTRDLTVSDRQSNLPRHWISEEAGYAVMTSANAPTLRVPVHAVARPASNMRAANNVLPVGNQSRSEGALQLRGQGVLTGTAFPTDTVSIVTAFELQNSSPNEARTPGLADNGDLKYVGVTTDLRSTSTVTNPTGLVENSTLYFGVATHGDHSTPNPQEVEFDVYIDTNKDGKDDFVLFNYNYAQVTGGGDANDVFVTVLINLNLPSGAPGRISIQEFINGVSARLDTQPFNTNVLVLPVFAGNTTTQRGLGLTNVNSSFNYRVVTFSSDLALDEEDLGSGEPDAGFADRTPTLTYNAARPGLDFSDPQAGGVPAYFDLDGEEIPFFYDRSAFFANGSQGALLLHHHNARGNRDEVVRAVGNFKVYAPIVVSNASGR